MEVKSKPLVSHDWWKAFLGALTPEFAKAAETRDLIFGTCPTAEKQMNLYKIVESLSSLLSLPDNFYSNQLLDTKKM